MKTTKTQHRGSWSEMGREPTIDYFISPLCPICGEKISGVIGTDRLWCFECKVYWDLDMELESK